MGPSSIPSPFIYQEKIVEYLNLIEHLQIRERDCNRFLYVERVSYSSGREGTFFRTHGQRARRIEIYGIRLEIVRFIAKASKLLRKLKSLEPNIGFVNEIKQHFMEICTAKLEFLDTELDAYLNGEEFLSGETLVPKREVNVEAVGWNRQLVEFYRTAHNNAMRC
ncbi:hypothetical protein BGW39_001119 [Mortierella sp. 14UC]|nr:hypothetical protein BGW39_001119 [Mortierella sp. 14UC]